MRRTAGRAIGRARPAADGARSLPAAARSSRQAPGRRPPGADASFRRSLRRWYARHARDLPWRRTNDPYRVWLSEIMLQQTTVATVGACYERFLARFPDLQTLAAADVQDVLRQWEGLGYYRRARNLHAAAQLVAREMRGRFPQDVATLRTLPGIGRYTAGAIASFAFDHRAPIVEANTLRLYARLLGYRGDPRSGAGQRLLWEFAERILPRESPGRFNQALMELGATVCTPARPACRVCPLRSFCRAFAEGAQAEVPVLQPRPRTEDVVEASVAVRKARRFLLRRRGAGERWGGLWDFPRFELNGAVDEIASALAAGQPAPPTLSRQLRAGVLHQTGIEIEPGPLLAELRHSVTRFRIRLLCFAAERCGGRLKRGMQLRWAAAEELEALPLSVTGRRLARLIDRSGGCRPGCAGLPDGPPGSTRGPNAAPPTPPTGRRP